MAEPRGFVRLPSGDRARPPATRPAPPEPRPAHHAAAHPAASPPAEPAAFRLEPVLYDWLRRAQVTVAIECVHGDVVRGRLLAYDTYTLLVQGDDEKSLVFKHAIVRLVPETSDETGLHPVLRGDHVPGSSHTGEASDPDSWETP